MIGIKHLMVCLDLTDMDDILLRYTSFLCDTIKEVEQIIFVHNIKFDFPEEAEAIIDKLERPLPEILQEEIEERLEQHFTPENSELDLKIVIEGDGSTSNAIVRLARIWDSDIILAGKKIAYKGSGLVVDKILSLLNFQTSVLMVPETSRFAMDNILSPTDFSPASLVALQYAQTLAKSASGTLQAQHVYSVPALYFPYIPIKDMDKVLRQDAEKSYKRFMQSAQKKGIEPIECDFSFSAGKVVGEVVYQYAIANRYDLIVVGARGKGGIAPMMLGSVASQLIKNDMYIPLLIVKQSRQPKV